MPKVIDVPGFGPTEFPDSMTDEQIVSAIHRNSPKTNQPSQETQTQQPVMNKRTDGVNFPLPVGTAGFPAAMKETLAGASGMDKALAGFGSGARNLYEGAKQMVGMGDPLAIEGNKQIRSAAPVSSFAGDVGMFVPTSMIPGANTMTGSAALGGAYGLMQPADSMKQRATSAAFGAGGAMAGKYLGDKVSAKASNWLAAKDAANAAKRGENAVVDQTLNEAHRAGYVFPPTAMNKTSTLEAMSGQFKTQQEAAWRNQQITNNLARQELGLKPNAPITEQAFKSYFRNMGKAYDDVGKLSPQAEATLEALKTVRFEAKLQSKHYAVSADPKALINAQELTKQADALESALEAAAQAAKKPELIDALRKARTNLAKAHTYQDATRFSTGDVNAAVLARDYRAGMQGSGPKLSGNLERIGKIADARPESLRMRGFAPNTNTAVDSGVSTLAAAASGSPKNLLAAGVPLLRGPIRNHLLSPGAQSAMRPKPSDYATGLTPKFVEWLLTNQAAQGAYPGVGYGLLNKANNYGLE